MTNVTSSLPLKIKEMIDNPIANSVLIWATASPVWLPEMTVSIWKNRADLQKDIGRRLIGNKQASCDLLSFAGVAGGEDGEVRTELGPALSL